MVETYCAFVKEKKIFDFEWLVTKKNCSFYYLHVGLDSSTARSVIECLSQLSKQGRKFFFVRNELMYALITNLFQGTIIFSIHQPRYSIFKLFDTVFLICKGKTIYHGSADGVLPYFTNQGYHCELHENPADFALDILIEANHKPEELQKLHEAYLQSPMHTNMTMLSKRHSSVGSIQLFRRMRQGSAAHALGTEFFYVSQRTLRNAIRNPALFLSQVVVAIVMGLLVGLVFFDMEPTTDPGVQNRLGAIFFIVVSQIFSTLTAVEPLIKERVLFIHVSVYFDLT
jgi:ATP-binding cassette subfamily G (WHITE) protein 2